MSASPFETPEPTGHVSGMRSDPEQGIVFFDFHAGEAWETKDKKLSVTVKKQTPSGRFEVVIRDARNGESVLASEIREADWLQDFLTKNGCTERKESPVAAIEPVSESKVIDFDKARKERGLDQSESVSGQAEKVAETEESVRLTVREDVGTQSSEDGTAEMSALEEEIAMVLDGIEEKRKLLVASLDQARAQAEQNHSPAIGARLLDIENEVSEQLTVVDGLVERDDALDEALEGKVPTPDDVSAKQSRLQAFQETLVSFGALAEEVRGFADALAALSQEREKIDTEMAGAGREAPATEPGSGEGEKLKKEKKRAGKGGGSDGGDGGDEDAPIKVKKAVRKARLLEKQARHEAPGVPVVDADVKNDMGAAAKAAEDMGWRKELDAFLERPKAREKVVMFEDIIREEWDAFEQYSRKESLKMEGRLSFRDKMTLWEKKGLPALEEMVAKHLNRFDGIDLEKGQTIFRAILRNLEEEAKKER